ncbi:hypothetical protein WJX84_010019 [Apatococcus fuscideae]|uniref:Uncharacterized protein n=1 Tax=Apatococcus fuscideae TaxID=2026836 RepID=A0AAW1SN21_9CHLO
MFSVPSCGAQLLSSALKSWRHIAFKAVYCVDPKLLLQPSLWQEQQEAIGRSPAVRLSVPASFQPNLSAGKQELGEGDTPENSWYFAKRGDLFEYTFRGSFPILSGFASIVHENEIRGFLTGLWRQHQPVSSQ